MYFCLHLTLEVGFLILIHFTKIQNEVRELKFNITPKCQSPLVETDNSLAYVEGVDGCGLPCNSPLFTKEEHEQVQRFTQTLVAMCLTTNLFAVVRDLTLLHLMEVVLIMSIIKSLRS